MTTTLFTKQFREKFAVRNVDYLQADKTMVFYMSLVTDQFFTEVEQEIAEKNLDVEWLCFFTPLSHLPIWKKRTSGE